MENNYMVSIEEAMKTVDANVSITTKTVNIPLYKGINRFLSEDVKSPINMPPFNQSAMDGYAVNYDDSHQNNFILRDEIKAGDNKNTILKAGEAVRIFTGAPTPTTANAVIMQEKTSVENNILTINDSLTHFKNIRPEGEQILKNTIALSQGTPLNAAAIGFLATLGFTTIPVYRKPKITIVVTGNELVTPGETLAHGQIYESNAIMLQTALAAKGFAKTDVLKVKDDYNATKDSLDKAIKNSDFVFISGGISVGDYDFVGKALLELNTQQHFYKIKQKPGKPLFYGTNNNTQIFALPGNPASALTCFYIYIETALQKFIGNKNYAITTEQIPLATSYHKKGIRGEFLKGKIENNKVFILENQSSAMLNSYAQANALIYIKEDKEFTQENSLVTVFRI
ncbi:molybdopterin molybdotransferase MoeA [Flavobacteriaceae bacterium]|nr:molybdopterin molybdotransferase MoeA [Flavobacteriaceae bacterium]